MKTFRGQRQHVIALGTLLFSVVLLCPEASALNPSLEVSQYAHTSWKVQDGFPAGSVRAIVQTPDGYLWLGTDMGLVRFDGVHDAPLPLPPGQHLPSTVIGSLLVTRDGTLWIGTRKGLASWRDGKLVQYPELAGNDISSLLEDHEGTLWAGVWAPPSGRLCAIQRGSVHCEGENGLIGWGVLALYEDNKGNLWAGSHNGLWRWKPGPPKLYKTPPEDDVRSFAGENNGALLAGVRGSISRVVNGRMEIAYSLPPDWQQLAVFHLLVDRDGGVWAGTARGIVHVRQAKTDFFGQLDGLSGNQISALFQDREGNIWAGTSNGLDRFREFAVSTFSVKQGVSAVAGSSVLKARDESLWFSSLQGPSRLKNGQLTIYGTAESADQINPLATADGFAVASPRFADKAIRFVSDSGLPDPIAIPLFEDGTGRIWLSTRSEVGYMEHDRFASVSSVPGATANSMVEVAGGDRWIGRPAIGLYRLSPMGEVQQIPWHQLGNAGFASTLIADPERGFWIGFYEGGVAHFSDGQVRASYAAADGLGEGTVSDIYIDGDHALWVSTKGGLSRLKNGRVATLTTKNGLPCDDVQWAAEDDDKAFWLKTSCGLIRILKPQLEAWVSAVQKGDNSSQLVEVSVFGIFDGVRSAADVTYFHPPVAKSSDGKLWFSSADGLSVIDPHHLPFNPLPPPVTTEQIVADRKTYDAASVSNGPLRLPALTRDLEVDYTALSLVASEKVRFRYKLEGHDRNWQEAGARRQAFYNDLPPGNYRFRVTACNNSGVWNEAGTFLDFAVAPAYYQTASFRLLSLAAFLLLFAGLYQLRLRRVASQYNMRLEERVNERTRIARDLHDTLLQSFQGVLLQFHALTYLLPDRSTEIRKRLETVIEQARKAITEGRDAVEGLRSSADLSSDLAGAISRVGEELSTVQTGGHSHDLSVNVEGTPRNLAPILGDEVYRIACEALRNAFRHAHALRIEVEIHYGQRQFRLRVRDDGKGFDQKVLSGAAPAGHYGLKGMYERAKLVGGKLAIWSEIDSGTEVELTIPAGVVYAKSPAGAQSMSAGKGIA